MCPGQHTRAECGVGNEFPGIEAFNGNRSFHVPELSHIEFAPSQASPPQERITGGLHDALASDDALSAVWELAPLHVRLQNRTSRFLELQNQRIIAVRTVQQ